MQWVILYLGCVVAAYAFVFGERENRNFKTLLVMLALTIAIGFLMFGPWPQMIDGHLSHFALILRGTRTPGKRPSTVLMQIQSANERGYYGRLSRRVGWTKTVRFAPYADVAGVWSFMPSPKEIRELRQKMAKVS